MSRRCDDDNDGGGDNKPASSPAKIRRRLSVRSPDVIPRAEVVLRVDRKTVVADVGAPKGDPPRLAVAVVVNKVRRYKYFMAVIAAVAG